MSRAAKKSWWDDQTLWGCFAAVAGLAVVYGIERGIDRFIGRDSGLDYLYLLPVWVAVSIGGRKAGWFAAAVCAVTVAGLHDRGPFAEPRHLAAVAVNLIALTLVASLFDTFGRTLARARTAAVTDPLTGIANRRSGFAVGRAMVRSANVSGGRVAVVTMDCDNFKRINDERGHSAGDEALKAVAKALAQSVRASDKVFRLGGDEFVMVLADAGQLEAEVCLGRVRSKLEKSSATLGYEVMVSSGSAVASRDGATFDELLDKADARLYRQRRLTRDFPLGTEGEAAASS
ncbi:MAG: GGDEF domain-containing protein [Fimbriimonadaceae bacterium]|nr:GGDEF domain-containing protein [Fimbriimonadaceae bacterium]